MVCPIPSNTKSEGEWYSRTWAEIQKLGIANSWVSDVLVRNRFQHLNLGLSCLGDPVTNLLVGKRQLSKIELGAETPEACVGNLVIVMVGWALLDVSLAS